MNEVQVGSWAELQEAVFADSWDPDIGRFRLKCAFRGLSDVAYRLETALMRLGGNYAGIEYQLLRSFRKYAPRSGAERESVWHWISLAQHSGLPTRLMDWTYSPFVAMHFATANLARYDVDGAIWAVNIAKAHQLLPGRLRRGLEQEGADAFTVTMLSDSIRSLEELGDVSKDDVVLFFEPPALDERVVNQYALHSMMTNPATPLDDWLRAQPDLWRKIVIPSTLKWEVRDKLDQANITERVLFPGLNGLSRWLRRYYTPSTAT